jgi:alpha-amylase/alpha-mannosidase (GH57 family)
MHGIKDYWDMVRILDDYPGIKQAFNFTPSLLVQIEDYLGNKTTDLAYNLSSKNPELFTDQEKIDALKTFFLANSERMVKRYPRYAELLEKRGIITNDSDLESTIQKFNSQDFRDLQVWWNLSWVGEYSRFGPPFKYYLDKQRDFSEEEKNKLLKAHVEILEKIIPHHVRAMKRRQIEVSFSPFYHPILPLLCDTAAGMEANKRTKLPGTRFRHPEDANYQVKAALEYGEKIFGIRSQAMWPSEGSVSTDVLKILVKNKITWTATDEMILQKTLVKSGKSLRSDFIEKYFAYNFKTGKNSVKLFFRDHDLSDLIGFVYSQWSPDNAAKDFISRLHKIRESIISHLGKESLEYAVVPIILDGENAWEFYQTDGKDFLRTLYFLLSNDPQIETVLPSDVKVKPCNSLKSIEPGSWINGNFDIWIGHEEDNRAWDLLYHARKTFEKTSKKLSASTREKAYREILIAEGSDWFWWYGDKHKSPQANEFDELFRYHLKQVYITLGAKPLAELDEPIKRKVEHISYRQPTQVISPKFDHGGIDRQWNNAGFMEHEVSSMQKTGMLIKRILFGNDRGHLYLRIDTSQKLSTEKIVVEFFSPNRMTLELKNRSWKLGAENLCDGKEMNFAANFKIGESIQIALSYEEIRSSEMSLGVSIYDGDNLLDSLPQKGVVNFKLFQ